MKRPCASDRRKEGYFLTEKGLDLIPLLLDMADWSARHDPHTEAPAAWIALVNAEKDRMLRLIRETVQNGGSVFGGEESVWSKVAQQ